MNLPEIYMQRCLHLAELGLGFVRPNPIVGAVLVYNDHIIGEGYHQLYGGPHAEVQCLGSVKDADMHLIDQSIMYVSLEPCAHFGKTPPCADLIIKHNIPRVVIGCRDPFNEVNGKGIEKLRQSGTEVLVGILENECRKLNRRFFTFHIKHRPYIILKWAQSRDGQISAGNTADRTLISNDYSNRLVHKWRSEEASVMVGTNTALSDDPSLTTRLWKGNHATRLVLDLHLRLPGSLKLFDGTGTTIIFNLLKNVELGNLLYYKLNAGENLISQICNALYVLNIQSVLVEGGTRLLQSFIDENLFDEIRVIGNTSMHIGRGMPAPQFPGIPLKQQFKLLHDEISIYENNSYATQGIKP